MDDFQLNKAESQKNFIHIKVLLITFLKKWPWFAASLLVFLTGAFLYLRYTIPIYEIKATLLIKDEKKAGKQLDALQDLGLMAGNKLVENEIEILKSRSIMERVVDDLRLTVSYTEKGKIRDGELYGTQSPIWVKYDYLTSLAYRQGFKIREIDGQRYELQSPSGDVLGTFLYSQKVTNKYGVFRVFLNEKAKKKERQKTITCHFYRKEDILSNPVSVTLVNSKSTVLMLKMKHPVPEKGIDIIRKILEAYTFLNIEDKNREATNTMRFLEDRLRFVSNELEDVEYDVESYKSEKGFTDLGQESSLFLEKVKENDLKLNEVSIQLQVLDNIEDNLRRTTRSGVSGFASISSSNDPVLNSLMSKLSDLELDRDKLAATTQESNPLLQTVNTQISNTRQAIRESIGNQKKNLVVTQSNLQSYNSKFESAIRSIPKKEREFVNIKRQQGIKESLYLLLLQKREETAILYASTVTDSRLVDVPYVSTAPIQKKRNLVYFSAIVLAFLLPVAVIYLLDLLNDKIRSRKEIESMIGAPVFAEIGAMDKEMKDNGLLDLNSKGYFVEQFRTFRTNLQFAFGDIDSHCKSLLFTSSVSGEGKSFITVNLANSLAILDKKVIILELDLRRPKAAKYLGIDKEQKGMSNYLIGQSTELEIIKVSNQNSNLHIIPCGPIPPNPSELLSNGRMGKLMDYLKQYYDYVFIDTPPTTLVTDSMILEEYVDKTFYVVRHEYTPKAYLESIKELKNTKKFKSLNVVFNGVNYENASEYRYGYTKGKGYYGGYY